MMPERESTELAVSVGTATRWRVPRQGSEGEAPLRQVQGRLSEPPASVAALPGDGHHWPVLLQGVI